MALTKVNHRMIDGAPVNVKDWGATGDGVTDDTLALNTAFIYASNNGESVYIPAGNYIITDTLEATPHGSTFQTCHIEGAGQGNELTEPNGITVINATALTDRPAINIFRARFAYIGHMLVLGGGKNIEVDMDYWDYRYDSAWVNAGDRDSKNSPLCGVCVDAGVGATPPDGGYPSMVYSGGGGTLGFHLDHISVRRFVVGIMHNPGNAAQGDTWLITHPNITSTKVAIAAGQSQSRAGTVIGGLLWYCRTCYSGTEYGRDGGAAPQFLSTQFVVSFEMFSNAGGVSNINLSGCRAEEVHRIGSNTGGDAVGHPATFTNVDVHLLDPTLNPQTRPPIVFNGVNNSLHWTGGYLGAGDYTGIGESFSIIANNAILENVLISVPNRFQPYVSGGQDLNNRVQLKNCRVRDAVPLAQSLLYGDETRQVSIGGRISEQESPTRKAVGSTFYEYMPKNNNNYANVGNMSAIVFSATQLTFTNSDPSSIVVDDIIIWRFPSGAITHLLAGAKVTGIVGTAITCSLLYPREYYDETYLGAGGFTQIVQRMWAPASALTGDLNTSDQLTNVSPINILEDGDWISDAITGISAGTRVKSGGGTATITLSRATTATTVGTTLYWDRLHSVTTTAAF
jgi:hypothetical protein